MTAHRTLEYQLEPARDVHLIPGCLLIAASLLVGMVPELGLCAVDWLDWQFGEFSRSVRAITPFARFFSAIALAIGSWMLTMESPAAIGAARTLRTAFALAAFLVIARYAGLETAFHNDLSPRHFAIARYSLWAAGWAAMAWFCLRRLSLALGPGRAAILFLAAFIIAVLNAHAAGRLGFYLNRSWPGQVLRLWRSEIGWAAIVSQALTALLFGIAAAKVSRRAT